MQKRQEAVVNAATGHPVTGATVTVTTLLGVAATIYTADGAGLISGNTVTTDSNGRYYYYAADGRYTETITGSGITSTVISDILLEDPVDGLAALSASGGSALVGFLPSGIGATASTIQEKGRERLSVRDYMSDAQKADFDAGTALVDQKSAVQAAVNASYAARASGASGVDYASQPKVNLGHGKLRLASAVAGTTYMDIEGENTVVLPDAGITAFTGVGYRSRFESVVFIGGASHVAISTANVDSSTVIFRNCTFQQQTGDAIKDDAASDSTLVVLDECKYYNNLSAAKYVNLTVDGIKIRGGWVESSNTYTFVCGSASKANSVMTLDGVFTVPLSNVGNEYWIHNYGGVYCSNNCRFGGENSGRTVVLNEAAATTAYPYVPNNFVVVENCEVFATSKFALTFTALPNMVRFTNNRGLTDCLGISFNAAITDAVLATLTPTVFSCIVEDNETEVRFPGGTPFATSSKPALFALGQRFDSCEPESAVAVADKALEIDIGNAGLGNSQTRTTTGATSTNAFGASVQQETWTADGQFFIYQFTTGLSALATGQFTLIQEVIVASQTLANIEIFAGGMYRTFRLPPGKHILCHPFYYINGTSSQAVGILGDSAGLNTQVVRYGNFRIFTGNVRITTPNNVLYGSAAPTTLRYEKGDKVIQSVPAVGSTEFFVCTAAGTPGTWIANRVRGTFTCAAAATTTVNDTNVQANSVITLMPTNLAAGTLMGSAKSLAVTTRTAGTSFVVSTASAAAAAGTETFEYEILN